MPDIVSCDSLEMSDFSPSQILDAVQAQLKLAVTNNPNTNLYPRTTDKDGSWKLTNASEWTSGFFPGSLWYMYEYFQDPYWKEVAQCWTHNLEANKNNMGTHDVGFMMYCSYGNGYRLTQDADYQQILLTTATSLAARFDENIGLIRSWDFPQYNYPVIIDNMMNLELLFWATRVSGDSSFYKIATTHATNTLKHHFRDDHSVYQIVEFDKNTGAILWKGNRQGYNDVSSWARGQAWGIYGFTMCYRETGNPEFLEAAENITEYVLNHPNLPCDYIPYWDYEAPDIPAAPRDASAAAVTCAALLELSQYPVKNATWYRQIAESILYTLSTPAFTAEEGGNNYFVLKHSVGSVPAGTEIDVPLVYADYYYIEALIKFLEQ